MSVYRFPPITCRPKTFADQINKIYEEVQEVIDAYAHAESYKAVGIELMDVIQSCETALRMLPFTDNGTEMLRAETIEKNAKRGYYEVSK